MPRPTASPEPGPEAGLGNSRPSPDLTRPLGPSLAASGRLLVALATAKEYRAALSPLGAPAPPSPGETACWRRGGREYLVLVTGVGPVAAALAVGRTLGAAGRELHGLVGLGIAGSFDLAALPLGGLIAATSEIFPEYGLRGANGQGGPGGADRVDARGLRFPQAVVDGRDVYDRLPLPDPAVAARAMGLTLPEGVVAGPCLTVAGVSATPERAAVLAGEYHALAESMEGFAVALAGAAAGLPALELRAISNRVGSRPPADWDLPGSLAALGHAAARLFS